MNPTYTEAEHTQAAAIPSLYQALGNAWRSSVGSIGYTPTEADYWYFEGFARGLMVAATLWMGSRTTEAFIEDAEYLISLAGDMTGVQP